MRRILIPLFAAAAITSLFSCSKTNPKVPVIPTGNLTMSALYSAMKAYPKTTTLNATTGGSFVGTSGVRYEFPANAFVTMTGTPVTGNVQVVTADLIKRSQMIFSGVHPISGGEPLESGGEVYVAVTQGGQPLRMAPGQRYTAHLPQKGTAVPGMSLFFGTGAAPKSTAGSVEWVQNTDSTAGGLIYNGDTIKINTDSLYWANADRFLTLPDYQSFTITLNAGTAVVPKNHDEVKGFVLYDDYNGYWPLYNISDGVVTENHVPNIPVHFVIFTVINGELYGAIYGATPANGTNYNVTLNKIDAPAEFVERIDAL